MATTTKAELQTTWKRRRSDNFYCTDTTVDRRRSLQDGAVHLSHPTLHRLFHLASVVYGQLLPYLNRFSQKTEGRCRCMPMSLHVDKSEESDLENAAGQCWPRQARRETMAVLVMIFCAAVSFRGSAQRHARSQPLMVTPSVEPARVLLRPDADAVAAALCERLEAAANAAIAERGHFVLAIPGGSILKMLKGTAPAWASKTTLAYGGARNPQAQDFREKHSPSLLPPSSPLPPPHPARGPCCSQPQGRRHGRREARDARQGD